MAFQNIGHAYHKNYNIANAKYKKEIVDPMTADHHAEVKYKEE